jgi:hypothetical protein
MLHEGDEHPTEWWEVATIDNAVFRIDEQTAREITARIATTGEITARLATTNDGLIRFTDLYDTECVLVADKVSCLWEVTRAVRDGTRLRYLMLDTEQKEFDAAHVSEWEDS